MLAMSIGLVHGARASRCNVDILPVRLGLSGDCEMSKRNCAIRNILLF